MSDRGSKRNKRNKKEEPEIEIVEENDSDILNISNIKNSLLHEVRSGIELSTGKNFPTAPVIEQQIEIPNETEKLPINVKPTEQPQTFESSTWTDPTEEDFKKMEEDSKLEVKSLSEKINIVVTSGELAQIATLYGLNLFTMSVLDSRMQTIKKQGGKTLCQKLEERKEHLLENYLGIIRKYPENTLVKIMSDPIGGAILTNFAIIKEFQLENI